MEVPTDNSENEIAKLKQDLKEMVVEELSLFDIDPREISDDDQLFGDKFGLDSIDAVELVFQIKNHFGVAIRDMKEGRSVLQTIDSIAAFIVERKET